MKNPKHSNSTPVHMFCKKCLPAGFQNKDFFDDLFDCCLKLISLTCLIKVTGVSKDRPAELCKLFETYGSNTSLTGSGGAFIPKEHTTTKGKLCPCSICKKSGSPCKTWFIVWVSTAYHVVCDDFEAKNSEVWMNYDHEDQHPSTNIKKLQGHRIVNSSQKGDRSILECITHDAEVVAKIKESRSRIKHYEIKFNTAHPSSRTPPPLAVIVSHPHGLPKRISFGTSVEKIEVDDNSQDVVWTSYRYDAPTCRGSSGALVWFLGQKRVGYRDSEITTHTHKMGLKNNKNCSSHGLDFADDRTASQSVHAWGRAKKMLSYILCYLALCLLIHVTYFLEGK